MRTPRGQGTLELALGMMLFITVLLVGIHFAEVSFISLKVTESARFAIFNATGYRDHHFTASSGSSPAGTYSRFRGVPAEVAHEATSRYSSFDGRSGRVGGSLELAVTHAEDLSVRCVRDRNISFGVPGNHGGDKFFKPTHAALNDIFEPGGAMRCSSSARVGSLRIPERYSDGSRGLFKEAHWSADPFTLCGAGRAKRGSCKAGYALLLGDWSLEGPLRDPANQSVRFRPESGDNKPYRNLVKRLYQENGGSRGKAASRLAEVIGGYSPHDESQFYMSYAGWEWWYEDLTKEGPARDTAGEFKVPTRHNPSRGRERGFCFLGQDGC